MRLLPVVQYKQENNTLTPRRTPVYFTPPLALTPLTNLRHFLIYALSYSVSRPLAGCFLLRYPLIYDGNIFFYLRPPDTSTCFS